MPLTMITAVLIGVPSLLAILLRFPLLQVQVCRINLSSLLSSIRFAMALISRHVYSIEELFGLYLLLPPVTLVYVPLRLMDRLLATFGSESVILLKTFCRTSPVLPAIFLRMTRSITVGIPSFLYAPSGFGISTLLTGLGLYFHKQVSLYIFPVRF